MPPLGQQNHCSVCGQPGHTARGHGRRHASKIACRCCGIEKLKKHFVSNSFQCLRCWRVEKRARYREKRQGIIARRRAQLGLGDYVKGPYLTKAAKQAAAQHGTARACPPDCLKCAREREFIEKRAATFRFEELDPAEVEKDLAYLPL